MLTNNNTIGLLERYFNAIFS